MTQMNTDCFASVALVSVLIGVIGGSSMHSVSVASFRRPPRRQGAQRNCRIGRAPKGTRLRFTDPFTPTHFDDLAGNSTLTPGQLRLIPREDQMADWKSDYAGMQQERFITISPHHPPAAAR